MTARTQDLRSARYASTVPRWGRKSASNTSTAFSQIYPSVATDSAGNLSRVDVRLAVALTFGQRYAAPGAPLAGSSA